jgi:NRPS condensation-like uncharacterized protein
MRAITGVSPRPAAGIRAARSRRAFVAATAPLTALDEFYLHLDSADEPWTVHVEVALDRRLDEARLDAAIASAAARHPLARARLGNWRATDFRYQWEITDHLERDPLGVVSCPDEATLAAARARVLSERVALDASPPFRVTMARRRRADTLILNLHHAAGDGIGALRLMASILRAYSGTPDPLGGVDPLGARRVVSGGAAASLSGRIARARHLPEHLGDLSAAPARVVPERASDAPGYGFELLSFGTAETRTIFNRRRPRTSVNDVLLAALATTIWGWNADRGRPRTRLALTMPVNLRPRDWWFDVIGNFAACVRVPAHPRDEAALVSALAARTRRIKHQQRSGLALELLTVGASMPTAIKRQFRHMLPLTRNAIVDTAVLSNLGRVAPLPFVRTLHFSPPGRMPLGVSLGAATAGGRLSVVLRYRHAQFDAPAAAEFARGYRASLLAASSC